MAKKSKPTLIELELFCDLCHAFKRDSNTSFRMLEKPLKCSASNLSNYVANVNNWYGRTLIETKNRKRGKRLSADCDEVCSSIRGFLATYESLPKRSWPSITIGTTNAILTGLLPNPVRTFLTRHESDDPPIGVQFVESDWDSLARKVHNRELAFALGPAIPQMPFRNIYMKPLGPQIKAVVVFPPDHKKWGKRKKSLAIKDLASENLLVLPPEEQPTVFNVFPADKYRGGRQVVMSNYTSIMAAVRMGIGVSVMPRWPEALEMYQVRWLPITKCPTFQLAAYLRTDSESSLREEELEFLDIVEAYVDAKSS